MTSVNMKVSEILDAVPALRKLSEREVRPMAGFALAKLLKRLSGEVEAFEKARLGLYTRHGRKEGDQITLDTPEAKSAVQAGIRELLDIEVELQVQPVKASAFMGAVTPAELMAAEKFLENDLE